MMEQSGTSIRCGIILAAGEGKRLQPFIQQLRGDSLPKQYVRFVGNRSMLEHTFQRAEKVISPRHVFTVVSRQHLGYAEVRQQILSRPAGTIVVQPANKETGPGILLPLMHIFKRFPESMVAVFPSDHFVTDEELFMAHVDLAFRVVERHPSYVILLGIEPTGVEPEYGYILPGSSVHFLKPLPVREVSQFVEKPSRRAAEELMRRGGLWNTMVMVFNVKILLDLVHGVAPALYGSFQRIHEAIGSSEEMDVVERVYRDMEAVNFSAGFLGGFPMEKLLVLPVRGVFWSDWGSEQRIVTTLRENGSFMVRREISEEQTPFSRRDLVHTLRKRVSPL